jgi:hypothetical protein
MADDPDEFDTQSKINEEDRDLRMKERSRNEGEEPNDPVGGSNAETEASDGGAIRLGASSEYGAQRTTEEEQEDRS